MIVNTLPRVMTKKSHFMEPVLVASLALWSKTAKNTDCSTGPLARVCGPVLNIVKLREMKLLSDFRPGKWWTKLTKRKLELEKPFKV